MVDSSDTLRLEDCRRELHKLLGEEKLAGASLLIFANKQDIPGALPASDIEAALELGELGGRAWRIQVGDTCHFLCLWRNAADPPPQHLQSQP